MTAINLATLTPPDVIETLDFEEILAEHKAYMIALYPVDQQTQIAAALELESEPMLKLMQNAAYREMVLRARFNDEARALLLAFAKGADLDHIGTTYYWEDRLIVTPADPAANPPVQAVYEDDESYRERLELKPESWSTAGPTEGYEFHARSAGALVKDASVTSPVPGTTLVTVLSREGQGVPSQAVLDLVIARLDTQNIRPLSEEVLVQSAEIITYSIVADLYVYAGPASQMALTEAQAALEKYAADHHKLGEDIAISAVNAAAFRGGVQRVVLNLPADIPVGDHQAAYCTSITVNIAGVMP